MKIFTVLLLMTGFLTAETSLVLVRHGEGEHILQGIWSQTAPLTEKGYEEGIERGKDLLARGFSKESISHVYVSPRPRTKQTAQALAEAGLFLEEQIRFDERIAEVDVGNLEGTKFRPFGDADLWDLPFAEEVGGETLSDLRERLTAFLLDLKQENISGHIVIVSHGAPLRELLGLIGEERIKLETAEARIINLKKIAAPYRLVTFEGA